MQQPPPNYYGNPYPQPYPNKPGYPGNNPGSPYPGNGNTPPDYPVAGSEIPAPPSDVTTVDNDNSGSIFDINNLPKEKITIYATFPDSAIWHDRVFKGRLIRATNDHLTIYDDETKLFTTIVAVYVNFVEYTDPAIENRTKGR